MRQFWKRLGVDKKGSRGGERIEVKFINKRSQGNPHPAKLTHASNDRKSLGDRRGQQMAGEAVSGEGPDPMSAVSWDT